MLSFSRYEFIVVTFLLRLVEPDYCEHESQLDGRRQLSGSIATRAARRALSSHGYLYNSI